MKRWVWLAAGVVLTLAGFGAGGLTVVAAGLFDARASTPHNPIVAWAAHTTMIHAMKRMSQGVDPPPAFTPAQTIAGMHLYEQQCMMCHGGPGVPRADWVQGMNPAPPFLLDVSRRFTSGQLFWLVKNGVKMTGMPAWGLSDDDGRIWDVVAFLEAMPEIKPADFQKQAGVQPPSAARSPSGPGRR